MNGLDALAPGWLWALLFTIKAVVFLVWGMHAMIRAHLRETSLERWAAWWIGATFVVAAMVDAGTFAIYFWLGMAVLTWSAMPLYAPGAVVSIIGIVCWVRLGRG